MLSMTFYDLTSYQYVFALFPRLLGLIFFFAIGAFLFQICGLIGKEGILPVQSFLDYVKMRFGKKRFYYFPTLFWWGASDLALVAVIAAGTIISLLLALGIYPPLMLALLFLCHLSIITVGQDFLSFGWEMFLLEITFNTFFLTLTPNPFIWISLNLLLFRFHFQAGAVKLQSRDANWRNLTALAYHYQTQPLPNTVAWYIHRLPLWFHKLSCLFMFVVELAIPFAIFGNETMRLAVFFCFFSLQLLIWCTGNLSYLNHLTAAFSTILISDTFLKPLFGAPPLLPQPPLTLDILGSAIGVTLITLQILRLYDCFFPTRIFYKILHWFSPFHIVNRYGIFAIMTTKRYEIIVEGSDDGMNWKEYTFRYKPSELSRRPRRVSPYQPRLDWQVWFLPFSDYDTETWFQNFLYRLLQGSPEVLKLLRDNPFPNKPPQYIRAVAYDYVFSDYDTKRKTGHWWKRQFVGKYSPELTLRQSQ